MVRIFPKVESTSEMLPPPLKLVSGVPYVFNTISIYESWQYVGEIVNQDLYNGN